MTDPLTYETPSRVRGKSRCRGTILCTLFGLAATVAWAALWNPTSSYHIDISPVVFPLPRFILTWAWSGESVPAGIWYGSAIGQWALTGLAIDIALTARRRRVIKSTRPNSR